MDLSQSQTSGPSQIQPSDQSTLAYYAYNQYHQYNQYLQQHQFPYYPPDYTDPYQQLLQQSHQEPSSIHPPGVPIPPESIPVVGSELGFQTSYYPQRAIDQQQQQQLNSADLGAQFGGNVDAQGQQWQGNNGGFGVVPVYGGQRPSTGQSPYRGAGRKAGRPFGGGGRGHFGPRPNGSGHPFRGRGHGRGRSGLPVTPAQGHSTPSWPPPRMAWCELCRVDCNTVEILEQHKNGKRHKKNLHVYEELQKLNNLLVGGQNEQMPNSEFKPEASDQPEKVEVSEEKKLPQENLSSQAVTDGNEVEPEQQKVSKETEPTEELAMKPRMDHVEARGRGSKRKMRGGRGGKWMRTYEGLRKTVEPPKPKEIIPLICELCNVKCESQVVFDSHLKGKKHLLNLKRFQGHQAMLGQAALQALYPALQALYPALQALCQPNANASTSFATQFHQEGVNGPQDYIDKSGPSMFLQGQTSEPGPMTTSASAPPLVLEAQDQQDSVLQGSSGSGSQNPVTGEAKNQQHGTIKFEAEPDAIINTNFESGTSEFGRKEVDLPVTNPVVEPLKNAVTEAEQVYLDTATDGAVMLKSEEPTE